MPVYLLKQNIEDMKSRFNRGDMVKFYDRGLYSSGEIKDIRRKDGSIVYTIRCMGTDYQRPESQVELFY